MSLLIVSGNQQQAVAGTQLPSPLVVRVTDASDLPVPGQVVNFVVSSGGGSVFAGTALTDADGEAADLWTLGTSTADSQRVEVRAVTSSGTPIVFAVFRAVVLPGPAATVLPAGGSNQIGDILDPLPESLAVRVSDQFGNPVSGVSVAWSVTSGGGVVSPAANLSGASGEARTRWTLGGQHHAVQTALATAIGSTAAFTGVPRLTAAATFLKTGGDSQAAVVGTVLDSLAVTLRTTGNRPVPNALVEWMVVGGGGSVNVASSLTDASGVARAQWTLDAFPGGDTVGAITPSYQGNGPNGLWFYATTLIPGPFTLVTAGGGEPVPGDFTCAVTQGSAAYCWGSNLQHQLGSPGSPNINPVARPVSGGIAFSSVSAGFGARSCGLRNDGAPFCWGSVPQPPAPAAGTLRFVSVSVGGQHYCALTAVGDAYCFGANSSGQLGTTDSLVSGGHSFSSVTAGRFHSCGVTSAGSALCWGENGNGQLGTGPGTPSAAAPTPVAGSLTFDTVVAMGLHTCGLTTTGAAYCWGYGGLGGLGNGSLADQSTPQLVSGGHVFVQLSGGHYHTCGVASSGAAYCWGNGTASQLGNDSTKSSPVPVPVAGGLTFTTLSAGGNHTCGLATGGVAYCWGIGNSGALGVGGSPSSQGNQSVPVRVAFQP